MKKITQTKIKQNKKVILLKTNQDIRRKSIEISHENVCRSFADQWKNKDLINSLTQNLKEVKSRRNRRRLLQHELYTNTKNNFNHI